MKMRAGDITLNVLAVIVAVLTLFPLFWMFAVSMMNSGEAAQFPPPIWPSAPTFEHYRTLFEVQGVGRYLANSAILATLATLLALFITVPAGYAFAKLRFTGRDRLLQMLLAALVVPGQIGTLPLFLLLQRMGLVNTFAGALVPWLASIFGLYLVREYARSIPDEMLEAARIDGASEWQIFRHIVLPGLQPILVTLALFVFLGSWNDFLWPLIITNSLEMRTLPVGLSTFQGQFKVEWHLLMAGSVIAMLPVLIVYIVGQRWFIKGITMTGMGGR
jgi:multiple sugar transport system permease protein